MAGVTSLDTLLALHVFPDSGAGGGVGWNGVGAMRCQCSEMRGHCSGEDSVWMAGFALQEWSGWG